MSAIVLSDCVVKADPGKPNSFVLCYPVSERILCLDEKTWRNILDQLEHDAFSGNEPPFSIWQIPLGRQSFSTLCVYQVINQDKDGNPLVYLRINRVFYGPRGDVQEKQIDVNLTEADVCLFREFIDECTKPETD